MRSGDKVPMVPMVPIIPEASMDPLSKTNFSFEAWSRRWWILSLHMETTQVFLKIPGDTQVTKDNLML